MALNPQQDKKFRGIIANFRHFDGMISSVEEVTDDKDFKNDFGADSIDIVELVMEFEKEFECKIPDDIAEGVVTVADAKEALEHSII
jgi:acyl carrier protein